MSHRVKKWQKSVRSSSSSAPLLCAVVALMRRNSAGYVNDTADISTKHDHRPFDNCGRRCTVFSSFTHKCVSVAIATLTSLPSHLARLPRAATSAAGDRFAAISFDRATTNRSSNARVDGEATTILPAASFLKSDYHHRRQSN